MTRYTPITAEVKTHYMYVRSGKWREDPTPFGEEFDRWLEDTERKASAKAFRDLASRVRADFDSAGLTCGWVGALDDEAKRLEGRS